MTKDTIDRKARCLDVQNNFFILFYSSRKNKKNTQSDNNPTVTASKWRLSQVHDLRDDIAKPLALTFVTV